MIGSLILLKKPYLGLVEKQGMEMVRENLTVQLHLSPRNPSHQSDLMVALSVQLSCMPLYNKQQFSCISYFSLYLYLWFYQVVVVHA